LKDPKPNRFNDLQAIPDDLSKTALKCHFVAYIHVGGQLIEFGLLCLGSSRDFVRHCGPTTPSTLIKDASIKEKEPNRISTENNLL
jgi:hypothetical protein